VQANTLNYAAVNFWQSMGVSRIILSRELSLDEIEDIRQRCPEMELEVFVHGALCIAYSGRCLLSGYFNHRDPNQGTCTNACRWEYHMSTAKEDATGDIHKIQEPDQSLISQCGDLERHPLANEVYLLEEGQRRGESMPIMEDELGTYIMNSKDLRAIEHINRLVEIGIDSLKIEGRTKSHYYVARTAQLYRQAIDDAEAGKPFNEQLLGALEGLANRGYTDGFYQRHHTQDHQNYMENVSKHNVQQFVGEITSYDNDSKTAEVLVKNKFSVGDKLELITSKGNHSFLVEKMEDLYHQPMESALGSGYQVRIALPEEPGELGLLARFV